MKSNPPTANSAFLTKLLVCVALLAVLAGVFGQACWFEFVNFDDDVHIYENPYVTGGLTWENLRWAFGIHGPSQWHPLAWISHQADSEIFGLWPGGHHLTNVLFHAANVLLLFSFLAKVTDSIWRSAFVAMVFAVHPLNVESVLWISERRNVLSLFFGLLTLWAYAGYVAHRSLLRYVFVIGLFALSLMAKPMLVTLPFVLLLLDFWPFCRWNFGQAVPATIVGGEKPQVSLSRLVLEKIPLLLLVVGASVLTIWCQEEALASAASLPLGVRVLNALGAYALYLKKIFWPSDLAVFYPHPGFISADPVAELLALASIGGAILVVVSAWSVWSIRKRPYLFVGWFWFVGALIPMIGLIQVGQQRLADRYVYLPLIGLLVAITWWVAEVASAWRIHRSWLQLLGTATAAACMFIGWIQVRYWKDSVTLFEQALAVTESNSLAHNNLGLALSERHQPVLAMAHFGEALRIDPEHGLARYNLGVVLHDQGNIAQAIPQYQESLRLMPEHVSSHLRLGVALASIGELDQALPHFQEAVRLAPELPDAHHNLGIAFTRMNRIPEANRSFRRALELAPNDLQAEFHLASGLAKAGENKEAESRLKHILEQAPEFAQAHLELGKLLLGKGERMQAAQHFRNALRLNPSLTEAETNLKSALFPQ